MKTQTTIGFPSTPPYSPTLLAVFVLLTVLILGASMACGQGSFNHPADCWILNRSNYGVSFTGSNPSLTELKAHMQSLATTYNVPIEIIAAICYQESGLYQYGGGTTPFVVHNLTECTYAYGHNGVINANGAPAPPGLGLMQLTSSTATQFNVGQLITDWRYNLQAGVQTLVQKYNSAIAGDPTCLVNLRNQAAAKTILENWYYAVRFYYGSTRPDSEYLDVIYGHISNPPARLAGFFPPVAVTKPQQVIPGFTTTQGFCAQTNGIWTNYQCNTYSGPVHISSSFGPGSNPPTVQTLAASSVTSTSAVINGTVTNNGGAPVDHYYFYYWVDPNSPTGIDDSGITVSGNSFSAHIVGLSPGTPYQFRAYAHNSSTVNLGFGVGWGFGSIVSFQTGSTGSPAPRPDFDGDGNADILWQNNSTGQRTIWLMNRTAYMASADLFTASPSWQIASTGVFSTDGRVDIVWQNTQTGQCTIQLMNGTTTTGWADFATVPTPVQWFIVGAGDFNGDTRVDLLWENMQTGQVTIQLMNGTTTTGWADIGAVPTPVRWKIVGTGDFDGNGKVDILWQNTQTGQRTIQLMNGTQTAGWADLSTVSNVSWKIAGVSDFDRNGKVDILWQNMQTGQGQRTIELMNGTTTMGWADLPQVQTVWEMRNH